MSLAPFMFGLLVTAVVIFIMGFFGQIRSSRISRRLHVQQKPEQVLMLTVKPKSLLPTRLLRRLEKVLGLSKDSPKVEEARKALILAGFDGDRAVSVFLGIRLGLCLALPILALPYLVSLDITPAIFMLAEFILFTAGYFVPLMVLNQVVEARKKKIREELPDALDLMVVCVEAGQGLNAALKRVADEIMAPKSILPQELLKVNLEINAGQNREQAFRNLGERTGVEEVVSLCNILTQSERFGTSIAQALKIQSEALRTTRRLRLEEQAAKTPVKLVFPLILFIFPAILVVTVGPAIVRVSSSMLKD